MSADGTGRIYISADAWYKFLESQAPFLKGTEYSIGPIDACNPDCVIVEYAFSEECHPEDWSEPPHWLRKTQ